MKEKPTYKELIIAKEKAEESQERLLLACRSGGIGIWELDIINNILSWDAQMFQFYDAKPDTFGGTYESKFFKIFCFRTLASPN